MFERALGQTLSLISEPKVSLRRFVLLALASGLAAAALIAIAAILTRSFDSTDARFLATSFGFSIFSAFGAVGAKAKREPGALGVLGALTMCAAGLSFVLLLIGLWTSPGADLWRTFGDVGLLTLAASHGCLVLTARSSGDSPLIGALTALSVGAGAFDALFGVMAISGAIEQVDPAALQLVAVAGIVFVVTSVLPPILRRAGAR